MGWRPNWLSGLGLLTALACQQPEENHRVPGGTISGAVPDIVLDASLTSADHGVELHRESTKQRFRFTLRGKDGRLIQRCTATGSMTKRFGGALFDVSALDPLKGDAAQKRAQLARGERFTWRLRTEIEGGEESQMTFVRAAPDLVYGKTPKSEFWFTVDPGMLDALDMRCP